MIFLYTNEMDTNLGQRHRLSHRKEKLSKDERSKRLVSRVDILAYIVSILSLIFTTDQIRIIWIEHDASGVSLLAWSFYTLSAGVWFLYGYIHKEKILVITNLLWVAFSLIIIIGVMIYGQ